MLTIRWRSSTENLRQGINFADNTQILGSGDLGSVGGFAISAVIVVFRDCVTSEGDRQFKFPNLSTTQSNWKTQTNFFMLFNVTLNLWSVNHLHRYAMTW